jgi:hypothetical protein
MIGKEKRGGSERCKPFIDTLVCFRPVLQEPMHTGLALHYEPISVHESAAETESVWRDLMPWRCVSKFG